MNAPLANEAATVQFPLVKYADEIGWTIMAPEEALRLRGGEAGLFLYKILEEKLIELNKGLVTIENAHSMIQRMESVPKTIEGNREILGWLRGEKTTYDEKEKRD